VGCLKILSVSRLYIALDVRKIDEWERIWKARVMAFSGGAKEIR
jgi:hypothetical protein